MPDTTVLLSQFYIKVGGANAPDDLMRDLITVSVESSLHLPDVATLVLHDASLRWIDDSALSPGATIEVSARTGGDARPLFDGEIVEIEPNFGPSTQRLVVRAFDRLHRLGRGCRVRSFLNVSDGDLVRAVAREVGLQATGGPTRQIHRYVLQGNETNLAFLRRRAAALGYLLFVRGQTLHCEPLGIEGAIVEAEWGVALREFHPRLATSGQAEDVVVRGWDPATRQEIVGRARHGEGGSRVGGDEDGGDVARRAFQVTAQHLVTDRPMRTQAEADQFARAEADRLAGRFIEADGTCNGTPDLVAGSLLRVSAVGDRFSGTYRVTRATHVYSAGEGYVTHFGVSGQDPATLLSLLAPEPTNGRTAGFTGGLAIGIVTDNQDPEGQGRVKVRYPWLSGEHTSDWARVAVPGGGADRGVAFTPEVDDEVLVGFEMGDLTYPYVLGGLWNGRDAPPHERDEHVRGGRVQRRVIRSRTGQVITLDDRDGGGGITIADRNGNTIALDSATNTVTVAARGRLTLEARGQVELKGRGVTIDGGAGSVEIKGGGVTIDGGAGPVNLKGINQGHHRG